MWLCSVEVTRQRLKADATGAVTERISADGGVDANTAKRIWARCVLPRGYTIWRWGCDEPVVFEGNLKAQFGCEPKL
jgi:hypothetical protein